MSTIYRALRAVWRSPAKSGLLTALLAVGMGLTLTMVTVDSALSDRIQRIRADIGTDVTLGPADDPLEKIQQASFASVATLPHVAFVEHLLFNDYTGAELQNVVPAPQDLLAQSRGTGEGTQNAATQDAGLARPGQGRLAARLGGGTPGAGTLAERLAGTNIAERLAALGVAGGGFGGARTAILEALGGGLFGGGLGDRNLNLAIRVVGTDNPDSLRAMWRRALLGVTIDATGPVELLAGRTFRAEEQDVAVLSESLALVNDVDVGSTITINGTQLTVIGLFAGTNALDNNAIFVPLDTARSLFAQPEMVSQVTLYAEDAGFAEAIALAAAGLMGDSIVVTSNTAEFNAIVGPLEEARSTGLIGLLAALVASAAVILFSTFQTVRNRVREIGILKAIGASNRTVSMQFAAEALVVGLLAAILGAIASLPFAQWVADRLLGSDAAALTVGVSPIVFFYALSLAVGLAFIASFIPAWSVARVKPAEVLRRE